MVRIYVLLSTRILSNGFSVPYTYPNLSNRSTTTSPFTIVFFEAGSSAYLATHRVVMLLTFSW